MSRELSEYLYYSLCSLTLTLRDTLGSLSLAIVCLSRPSGVITKRVGYSSSFRVVRSYGFGMA